jgi:hypothetical protein
VDSQLEADYHEWLKASASGAEAVAATLSSFKRPSIFALVPVAGVIAAKFSHIHVPNLALLLIAIYLAAVGLTMSLLIVLGFGLKRQFLLMPLDESPEGSSVYRSENELFWILGRGKPLEYPLDAGALLLSGLILFEASVFAWLIVPGWMKHHLLLDVPAICLALALAWIAAAKEVKILVGRRGLR